MLLQILTLLGSLAMFLYGMSQMSGGLQKMAGNWMRVFMAKMTSNNFKCILTGIVVTAMVQSSTATTLLIVSFVNAGLLALGSAIAVIMGANIGTTVTAWIFALSFGGGSWSIATIAIPLIELTDIRNAEEAEAAINAYRDTLRNEHLSNIEKSSYPYETGSFYMDVINCIEKMGDFIINISQSVYGAKTI